MIGCEIGLWQCCASLCLYLNSLCKFSHLIRRLFYMTTSPAFKIPLSFLTLTPSMSSSRSSHPPPPASPRYLFITLSFIILRLLGNSNWEGGGGFSVAEEDGNRMELSSLQRRKAESPLNQ